MKDFRVSKMTQQSFIKIQRMTKINSIKKSRLTSKIIKNIKIYRINRDAVKNVKFFEEYIFLFKNCLIIINHTL